MFMRKDRSPILKVALVITIAVASLSGADSALHANPVESGGHAGLLPPVVYGVVNGHHEAFVFNADTLAGVSVSLPPIVDDENYDVAVMPDQSLAFLARDTDIWVVDLTQNPPVLAAGANPIINPIGNFIEDLALTADGRFLLATDGSFATPIGVISTATRTVVSLTSMLADHNSVEVCGNGSVLVTSIFSGVVRRLTISATGTLSDTGQSLQIDDLNNVACGPGGTTAVAVTLTGELRSFLVNGMAPVSTQALPGAGFGLNVTIGADGTKVFGRRANGVITAYKYNPASGAIGSQLWSTSVGGWLPTYYGVDQMAEHPNGKRLFASAANFVHALNTDTGVFEGAASVSVPTGIGLRYAPRLKSEVVADFGPFGLWAIYNNAESTEPLSDTPIKIATGDIDADGKDDLIVSFGFGHGVWVLMNNSAWVRLTPTDAAALTVGDVDGNGQDDVIADFPGAGLWIFGNNSSWTPLHPADSTLMSTGDIDGNGQDEAIIRFPGAGLWARMNNNSWLLLNASDVNAVITGDLDGNGSDDLIANFPGFGLYRYMNNSGWVFLHARDATVMTTGDIDGNGQDDAIISFPGFGAWVWMNNSSFAFLNPTNPRAITTGDIDGNGQDDVIISFSNGVWAWMNNASWKQLSARSAEDLVTGNLDGQ
jgi:hypothetical protein